MGESQHPHPQGHAPTSKPTVVKVEIPVEVPVKHPVGSISMRLYKKGDAQDNAAAAAGVPSPVVMSMAAFVFSGCLLLCVSGSMHVTSRGRARSFTRVAPVV